MSMTVVSRTGSSMALSLSSLSAQPWLDPELNHVTGKGIQGGWSSKELRKGRARTIMGRLGWRSGHKQRLDCEMAEETCSSGPAPD